MNRLEDEPLPTGAKALHEAVLLGRALLNFVPDALERTVLVDQAWRAAEIPQRGVSVRVSYVQHGTVVDESYVHVDRAGGGRHTHSPDPSTGTPYELRVDLGPTPCQDRFRRLHGYLRDQLREAAAAEPSGGPGPHPVALAWWRFVDAAQEACRSFVRPDVEQPVLTVWADRLVSEMRNAGPGAAERVASIARRLPALADGLRREGRLDVWASSALLVAAHVPRLVAEHFSGRDHATQLARYLFFALLEMRVSPWQVIYGVSQKVARENLTHSLDQAADDLLDQAEQHREWAVDGPLDRDYFSTQLFLGTPKAWAAMQLYRILKDLAPAGESGQRPRRRTVAEELAVRMQDGVAHQWLDVDDARTIEAWRQVHKLRRAGDEQGVRTVLREGELRLFRPRSARNLLLGPSPWSHIREE